jgi:glycosyltransferase involved in cell wall biosynthesis
VSNKKLLRKRYNLTPEKIVLFVGKFIERKRPLDFLKLANYYKNNKDIKFVMIGDGELMKDCKEFIKMKSLSNVSILGFCNQKVTRDIYNITDVLILPSEYDTWGLVINEAMSCGVSVVSSSQCGASYDLIKNKSTGFVYDNKNFKVLLRKFDMLIKNSKKIVKYKKNSKLLISKFTYNKTIDSINKILNK